MAANPSSLDSPVFTTEYAGEYAGPRLGQDTALPPDRRYPGADSVCWRCPTSTDCEIARMCLAHPTGASRLAAVIRAIRTMRRDLAEPLSLTRLAHAAMLSPFHFHRIFRHVTAATPARYLAALRMAEAKRLLVRSSMSVTEIAGLVGYASLGTFTSQFTRLVGTSPRSFRELMAAAGDQPIGDLVATVRELIGGPDGGPIGVVSGGPHDGGLALLGLFDSGVPHQRPAACTVASSPGLAALGPTPDGVYQLLAIAFDPTATVAEALADHRAPVRFVGTSRRPIVVNNGRTAVTFDITVRRPRFIDPPVVMVLPLLVAWRHPAIR